MQVNTVKNKTIRVISENEQIIVSPRDNEIFFEVVFQQAYPNNALVEAANEYKRIMSE
jgi:hypothetical protein